MFNRLNYKQKNCSHPLRTSHYSLISIHKYPFVERQNIFTMLDNLPFVSIAIWRILQIFEIFCENV